MTTEPYPLPRTPMEYISAGPYSVSFEWLGGRITVTHFGRLTEAIRMFWRQRPGLHEDGSADRRVIIDARGVVVLGTRDYRAFDNDDWCATHEAITEMHSCGGDRDELIEMELLVMTLNGTS